MQFFTKRKQCFMLALSTIIIMVLLSACQKEPESSPRLAIKAVTESVASADGIEIHYDVRGEGDPALVFVHCWSCDRRYWKSQADAFAANHKVVTIDLAGHGKSGLDREIWSMTAFGSDVATVINKLGLQQTILVGHSMGGPVIVEAARQLPGKVIGLVGVDNFQRLGFSYPEDQVKVFLEPFRADFEEATKNLVRPMFPENADSNLVKMVLDDMSSAPPEVAMGAFEETLMYYSGQPIVNALNELNLPLICISSDKIPTDIEGNRSLIRSFDVKIMEGAGHFPHMEDPETFNSLLTEAISELMNGQ